MLVNVVLCIGTGLILNVLLIVVAMYCRG